jgi:hypothetical protein
VIGTGAACPVRLTPRQAENRGLAWVAGAFVICPCHLPITLWALAVVLSGTAAGRLVQTHPYLAGGLITVVWAAATWRGFRYLASARVVSRTATEERSR